MSRSVTPEPELPEVLKPFRDSIVDKPPYVSGTLPLSLDMFDLYYRSGAGAKQINLARPPPEELLALANACQPATFGLGQKDVMDETYRKAGKMDANMFSTPLVPERTGLINIVRGYLLEGAESNRPIEVELYKLNVYGEGSFFKAHVDTPRSESMFGSLVLIFPTQHEGGGLVFRHGGGEWTFDSAQAVSAQDSPSIAFASFYSDVEHEVLPVTAGQRVTLTYNLYFGDVKKSGDEGNAAASVPTDVPHSLVSKEATIRSHLETALADPTFLPNGGTLGFGLRHVYPFSKTISHVPQLLKGSDAVVRRVFSALGFEPAIYLLYRGRWLTTLYLMDEPLKFDCVDEDSSLIQEVHSQGGIVVRDEYEKSDEKVTWVTTADKDLNRDTRAYMAYGNEYELDYAYGDMCLVVRIGSSGERMKFPSAESLKAAMKEKKGPNHYN
ncbi:hypothetical protein OF83DRAFT_1083747 [Amylostereum chailletii]|nr:hypothetical protein OF83DRAFT_1083747 [Amylostereum chailletii]